MRILAASMLVLLAASLSVPMVAADCQAAVLICEHHESNSDVTGYTFCVAEAGGARAVCYGEDYFTDGRTCTYVQYVDYSGVKTCADGSEETTCLNSHCVPVGAGQLSVVGTVIGIAQDRVGDLVGDVDSDGYPDVVEAAVCGNFTARDFINTATIPGTCVTTDDYDP